MENIFLNKEQFNNAGRDEPKEKDGIKELDVALANQVAEFSSKETNFEFEKILKDIENHPHKKEIYSFVDLQDDIKKLETKILEIQSKEKLSALKEKILHLKKQRTILEEKLNPESRKMLIKLEEINSLENFIL